MFNCNSVINGCKIRFNRIFGIFVKIPERFRFISIVKKMNDQNIEQLRIYIKN